MWQVDALTEEKALHDLRQEWRELHDRCPSATVFQSYEWLTTWWRHLGRRIDRRLFVITVRDREGRLVGIAPLMTGSWHGTPLRRLSFLGTGVSDYNDLLADPADEAEIVEAVHAYLATSPGWQIGDLSHLRDGGLWRKYPPEHSPLAWADYEIELCPYLALPTEGENRWKELLGLYPKKTRDHIGYYERRLSTVYAVENHAVSERADLTDAMTALFELHARRWNRRWLPGVLSGKRVQSFHREIAKQFLERDWLRLHILALDGEIQAALYCFRSKDRAMYYQGGFEPTLAKLSLGTVLTASAIRCAIDEGATEFDFLRGDEPYKERWTRGVGRMNVRRLIAKKSTSLLPLAAAIHKLEHRIETRFKDYMHHAYLRSGKQADVPKEAK